MASTMSSSSNSALLSSLVSPSRPLPHGMKKKGLREGRGEGEGWRRRKGGRLVGGRRDGECSWSGWVGRRSGERCE